MTLTIIWIPIIVFHFALSCTTVVFSFYLFQLMPGSSLCQVFIACHPSSKIFHKYHNYLLYLKKKRQSQTACEAWAAYVVWRTHSERIVSRSCLVLWLTTSVRCLVQILYFGPMKLSELRTESQPVIEIGTMHTGDERLNHQATGGLTFYILFNNLYFFRWPDSDSKFY